MELIKRSAALALAAVLMTAGCAGDDGKDGVSCTVADNGDGTATITCEDGTTATVANGTDGQSCVLASNPDGSKTVTCPDGTSVLLPAVTVAGKVTVSDQAVAYVGADVVINFKVAVNGALSTAFVNKGSAYRHAYQDATATTTAGYYRTSIATADYTVAVDSAGLYTVTMPGLATTVGATPTTFLVSLNPGNTSTVATVVVDSAAGGSKVRVSDTACMNCHGNNVFHAGTHRGANPQGSGACIVCHVRADRSETRLGTGDSGATAGTAPATRLMGYVHGIHNSHNMPDGVYSRNGGVDPEDQFAIGFPGYMNNCATCHDTSAALTNVATAPVKYSTCISCHDSWDGFPATVVGGAQAGHRTFTDATNCGACHGVITTKATLSDFHNGLLTPRRGLIWDGADQSVVLAPTINVEITGVDVTGGNVSFTWTAVDGAGAPLDPCNSDITAGPVFFGLSANAATGQAASNMSVIRSYAVGNDWVNDNVQGGTSPGQPAGSVNLAAGNTTCAANVATTVVGAAQTVNATKGVIGLQGKPQVRFTPGIGTTSEVIQVRAKSATREFVIADGTLPADTRRQIVSVDKCKACHLGSIYQHGGNRVDAIELCVMCHNPAGNEGNVRINMAVDATEAYDGKVGEAYDLRNMIHAIHSAGATGRPLVYYRTNGIYFFGNQEALAEVANWPGTGCQVVAGAGAPSAATGTQCDAANTTAVTKNHNFIEVHYPRPLNDCSACHVNDSEKRFPDPTAAVAMTVDVGGTTYNDVLDDVLLGPATASCMSCHQSGDKFTQSVLRAHAYQNGWIPQVFANGRQDLLDGAAIETCVLCHGEGRTADFSAAHGE